MWALLALLAVALPVALPYAIWPPRTPGAQSDPAAEYARRAAVQVVGSSNPAASLLPRSVSVENTGQPWSPPHYRAEVAVRGPYGIPVGSAVVEGSEIGAFEPNGRGVLAVLALLSGVVAVSVPLFAMSLRQTLRLRLEAAT
jgi:hypothetical protein